MAGIGIRGAGMVPISRWPTGALGMSPLDFAVGTFTPSMAKRATSVFAASPIVQGDWDGTGTPDVLVAPTGTLLANPIGYFWPTLDLYQGSIVLWVTPEWAGNDGLRHDLFCEDGYGRINLYKQTDNRLYLIVTGRSMSIDVSGWAAGTRYFIVARWDTKNTLDGTNYFSISVNDGHTFGQFLTMSLGLCNGLVIGAFANYTTSADALIQGLTVYRRPLWDGAYGKDVGNGDEIALMHAAGAGQDPCLVTGSWDVCLCVPTDATPGALTTGTGNAWSHPHGSSIPAKSFLSDGGYLGDAFAVGYNGTSTVGNAGSGATLDDICAGGGILTVESWIRPDADTVMWVVDKSDAALTNSGWSIWVRSDVTDSIRMYINCATSPADADHTRNIVDGKWHHVVGWYNDTTKACRVAVDGVWGVVGTPGVGAYQSDAAHNLTIGGSKFGLYYNGAIAWVRLSDNDRYGGAAGTNFVPPRTLPAADGNTVEQWSMAEGTGAASIAVVTSPANDCALTNHTWERTWDQQGTPVIPQSLEFDGAATLVNCGSGATLDDLGNAKTFTFEQWVRADSSSGARCLAGKGILTTNGWHVYLSAGGYLNSEICLATTSPTPNQPGGNPIKDGRWHHVALYYNDATKTGRLALDGRWGAAEIGAGAWQTDAAQNLIFGRRSNTADWFFDGSQGWARISNNDRYNAATLPVFVPTPRTNPPAPDGNTVEQWNFTTGAGLTEPALVTSPANDGAITMGAGRWWNTPGQEWESPGSRLFNWGYDLGNDAADEGTIQTFTGLTAGANYVARIPVHVGADSNGQPEIIVYDETNGAAITTFLGPQLTGLHTGANNSATLIAAAGNFPQSLVGATVYNITDGSSATITAISGDKTTITGALGGGTDNDWDTNDVYRIVWTQGYPTRPWCETFTWELPTIARNGVVADCTSFSLRLLNALTTGTMYWHQAEVQSNLIDNPSMEAVFAGVPPIPPGWLNFGLDAGDTQAEAVIVHSGLESLRFNAGAISLETMYQNPALNQGDFYAIGLWTYSTGGTEVVYSFGAAYGPRHSNPAIDTYTSLDAAYWLPLRGVSRQADAVIKRYGIYGSSGAGGLRYADDAFAFVLTPITLTATPANQANSAEGTGLRVDGYDALTQAIPAGYFGPVWGWYRWRTVPRHASALLRGFGNTASTLLHIWGNAANYIRVYMTALNQMTLEFNDGGGVHQANWNCAGALVAGTSYLFEVQYIPTTMWLRVDNVVVATIVTPITFAVTPTIIYDGSQQPGGEQIDAVFAAP